MSTKLHIFGSRRKELPEEGEITHQSVVGNCPICGSPIFGPIHILSNQSIQLRRTCSCAQRSKDIRSLMLTK